MKLEDLTVVLRPRRPWEAVDLGCSLVRRDYGRILLLWLATVGPLWVVLAVALRDHPGWFSLAVWWLKPLYDRVPLYFISRATFGDRPGFRETWKAWPRLWLKFLLPALLWRRLSMIRAFALPVWMLEGQRGAAARARLRGLSIEGGSSGSAATVAFLHLEIAVFFGLLMLTAKLAPSSGLPPIDEWFSGGLDDATNLSHAFEWYSNLLYLASITLIEPFYVGAGFGLYLNCRSKMEGWDIEVVFRMLAQRLQQAAQQSVAVLLMIGLLLGSALGEEPKTAEPPEGPRATLEEVLARPEFEVHSKTERVWIPDKSESGSSSKIDSAWLNGIFLVIGMSGLIALVVFIALGLAKYLRSASLPMKGLRGEGKRPARMVMGLEITEESLPEDLLGAARAAWAAGQPREALSLLYRGALARLVLRARVGIRDSDTEDDCLKRVTAEAAPELAAYFSDLTKAWVTAAYAGIWPSAADFDRLCGRWPYDQATLAPAPQRQPATAALQVGLLLMMLLVGVGCGGHWEDVTHEIGYKGRARTDPFLAAREFLTARGHSVERRWDLSMLPEADMGVVLASAEGEMSEGRAQSLLNWVRQGGELVYFLGGTRPYNDWGFRLSEGFGGAIVEGWDVREMPLLEQLGVKVRLSSSASEHRQKMIEARRSLRKKREAREEDSAAGTTDDEADSDREDKDEDDEIDDDEVDLDPEMAKADPLEVKWDGETLKLDVAGAWVFEPTSNLKRKEWGAKADDNGYYVLSLRHGAGRVTLVNHAKPLRNRYLGDEDHGLWLDRMAGEPWKDVWFVSTEEGSFWLLLWQRAGLVVIGVVVLIALWLWMSLPRFGPLRRATEQETGLEETRRFSDHIASLGAFFFGINRSDLLLQAAREAVLARIRQRHPAWLHEAEGDSALMSHLAETSKLPVERVQEAMRPAQPSAVNRRHVMVHLQDLQTLRNAL